MTTAPREQALVNVSSKRLTLGVFSSGLEQYQTSILQGVIASAQEQDVNLIVYSGGELDSPVKDHVNGNLVYELATPSAIDALILFTGTLLGFIGTDRKIEFSAHYPVPKVCIGLSMPNAHNILLDNEFGMRAVIKHLIDVHHCRRIAFIQGPAGNEEAALRFQIYQDVLKESGISYDSQLVVSGQFQPEDGEEAIRILLDERAVQFEAIVGANDNMAIGALTELQNRNITVPGEIAIVGFDDIEDAEAQIPALTTVRQPLFEQGKCAVELALALCRGENVVTPFILKPEVVIRRSCGCFASSVDTIPTTVSAAIDAIAIESLLIDSQQTIVATMDYVIPGNYYWLEALYNAFVTDLFKSGKTAPASRFISTLDSITHELLLRHTKLTGWHEMLTVMRQLISPIFGYNLQLRTHAENIWQQARLLISEALQHAEANKLLQMKIQSQALNAIGEPLLTVTNMVDLSNVMADGLPMLGVKSCCIALYEDQGREWSRVIFRYDQADADKHVVSSPDATAWFQSKDLVTQLFAPLSRRYTVLIEALHFDTDQFGFLVLEIKQAQAQIYETLRKQISSALHSASIVQQLEEKHNLLRTLIDSLPDRIYAKDADGRFTLKNEAYTRQMGASSAQEVIGKTDYDYYPQDMAEQYRTDDQIVIRSGQALMNREEPKVDAHGDHRWILTTKIPLRDNQGKVIGLVDIGRDITERKIAEVKLRHLNRTLAVLSDVNEAIVRTRLVPELFEKVCHIAVEQGEFRMAWIGLLDAETGCVNPVAQAGIVEDYLEKLAIVVKDEPRGHGPTAGAVLTGKHVVVNDVEHDPRMGPWREDALRLGYRASAAFPLKVAGNVAGTLNLYADTAAFFDDAELKLLDEMTDDIAFAMEFAEHETQRQLAEVALKLHMQAVEEMGLFLQTTLDSFPANTVVLAVDGTILNVNAPWIHFAEDNGSKSAMHFVETNYLSVCDRAVGPHSEEAGPAAAGIRSVIDGSVTEFNLEYPCYTVSEGRWFTMRVTAFPEPAPRRVVVAHINITDRKQAEEKLKNEHNLLEERVISRTAELQTTKERVEAILSNSADAIVIVHRDFRIRQTSASFNSMFRCDQDEYFGQPLDALIVSKDREGMARNFQSAAEEQKLTIDIEAQRKDGHVFDVELSIGFISDDSFVCTFHDISARKQVEQSLRAAVDAEKEMNELKSRFVSMASHEFRTPLASILATVETLTVYYDRLERSQIDARLDKIRQQIRHMTDIMENMLQLTRIQSGRVDFKPVPGDLDVLCDEIIEEFASHPLHKGRLLYTCMERPVRVNFDGRLMRQIISNLVANALKYSPNESLVRIELTRDDESVMLKVKDEGIGIPADDLKRLFEPFHRASNVGTISGTGLGLIITKEAVELHGGTIKIDSQVDKGTQFTVILPNRRQK